MVLTTDKRTSGIGNPGTGEQNLQPSEAICLVLMIQGPRIYTKPVHVQQADVAPSDAPETIVHYSAAAWRRSVGAAYSIRPWKIDSMIPHLVLQL